MFWAVIFLIPIAFCIGATLTLIVRNISLRVRAIDTPPVPGQIKAERRFVPNTGGIAIYLALVGPIIATIVVISFAGDHLSHWLPEAIQRLPGLDEKSITRLVLGLEDQTPLAMRLIAALTILHILGLIDDRRPLGPFLKLAVMTGAALLVATASDTRMMTFVDPHVGGTWLSILITVLWLLVVTNAMNFMDNMDGLSAGVAVIVAFCFLSATLLQGQWFVSACLALLIGSLAGFLVFNFPTKRGESIFMGDGGSLVVGFLLAVLTVRVTYFSSTGFVDIPRDVRQASDTHWYALLMPFVILAVPIYDFLSVCIIRIRAGKSPFVGDLNHLSHRIAKRGLSRRGAVFTIYLFTAATGIAAIPLAALRPWQAMLVGIQTVLLLLALAIFEWAHALHEHEESHS